MALGIDTKHLLEEWMPWKVDDLQHCYGIVKERYQLLTVYVYARVLDIDIQHRECIPVARAGDLWAALNWQEEQDVDLDEVEVFHHLKQLDAMTPSIDHVKLSIPKGRPLVACVQAPSFTTNAQGRNPASFHRFSLRSTYMVNSKPSLIKGLSIGTHTATVVPGDPKGKCGEAHCYFLRLPEILWDSKEDKIAKDSMRWQVQLDFVDLCTPRTHLTARRGKRRRTLYPFLQVPDSGGVEESPSRHNPHPLPKRFKGVRYRPDRRTWTAEMKPPKTKNKVSFGDFKSQTEAAWAADAAFHHYDKPHMLNFGITPHILSSKSIPAGLTDKDKLTLVRQQAKWLASMASTLPPTPATPIDRPGAIAASVPFHTPEPTRGSPRVTTLGFRSFSEISSSLLVCGSGPDEADHGVSQFPQFLLGIPMDAMASSLVGNGRVETMEPASSVGAADHVDRVGNEFEGAGRSVMFEWSADDAYDTASSVRITEEAGEYCPERSSDIGVTNFVTSAGFEQAWDDQLQSLEWLSRMSSPAPSLVQAESPRHFVIAE